MRVIRFLVALACLLAGAIVGALNRGPVQIDLGPVAVPTTLGVALIAALLLGVLLGGLAITASLVLPLQRRLARAQRAVDAAPTRTPES